MHSDQPFQKLIYAIRYSQLSITFAVFDMFVCVSFMCLLVHVDLSQPLAARNNEHCLFVDLFVCLLVCLTKLTDDVTVRNV